MDALIARRKLVKSKLTRVKAKVDHENAQLWNAATAGVYDQQITDMWKDFNSLFEKIMSSCPEHEEEVHLQQYDEIADRFDEVKVAVKRIIGRMSGTEPQASKRRMSADGASEHAVTVKLPKLETPTFSGSMLEWTSFRDLFMSSIHNHPTLRGAEKLSYLKGCLKGSPAELLQPFSISDANYEEAWATLNRRYHNTRELIKTHLNRLIDMPILERESGIELRRMVDIASSVVRALRALERPIGEDSDLAMLLITTKLDNETHKLWETKIGRERIPKMAELIEFLDDRAVILCSSEFGKKLPISETMPEKQQGSSKKIVHAHHTNVNACCLLCSSKEHLIGDCEAFLKMTVADRRAKVVELKLCYKCMRAGHLATKCFSSTTCSICQGAHHSLLHIRRNSGTEVRTESVTAHIGISSVSATSKKGLMATATIAVEDNKGRLQEFRALLDPGSDVSFVSERAAKSLKLERKICDVNISGVGESKAGISNSSITLGLRSNQEDDFEMKVNAYILPKVTTMLPKRKVNEDEVSHLRGLPLADPGFMVPGYIDILLGADVFFDVMRCGRVTGAKGNPIGLFTAWGYAVGGICPSQSIDSDTSE